MINQLVDDWIDGRHLSDTAICAFAGALTDTPHQLIVIDDFLLQRRFRGLQELFLSDGRFEPVFKLSADDRRTAQVKFEAASDAARVYTDLECTGALPSRELSPSIIADARFREFCVARGSRGLHPLRV